MRKVALVGYFAVREEAGRALRELAKRGFHHALMVYKGADGDIRIRDPFLRRVLWIVLGTAIAAGLAKGLAPPAAVRRAKEYITEAIKGGLPIGSGHGPTNHLTGVQSRW